MSDDSLHLVGDGDDLDVIADVERTFGISIAGKDAKATLTVGQLHDLIEQKCGNKTQACLSQLAFYRLRRALKSWGIAMPITPSTPIAAIDRVGSIARTWKALQQDSGLQLPPLETPFRALTLPWWSRWLVIAAGIAGFAGSFYVGDHVFGVSPLMVLLLLMIGPSLLGVTAGYALHLMFRDIPRRIETVGDLAREAAGYTFSELRERRIGSPSDRWFALLAILRKISGHKPAIARGTTFFAR